MTPLCDFLRAVKEEPFDDTPRLVFADWLDENGEPERGEFVRLQVKRARLAGDDSQQEDAREREQELLEAHKDEWLGPFHDCEWEFRRGLLELKLETSGDFSQRIEAPGGWLASRWIDALTVRECHCCKFLQAAELYLNALALRSGQLRDAGTKDLAASPLLANLTSLSLRGQEIVYEGAQALAGSPYLTSLSELDLSFNDLCPQAALALTASPSLSGLCHLSLDHWNEIGDEGVRALATSPCLTHLLSLGLHGNRLHDAAALALASSPGLRCLGFLRLSANSIGNEGARALAASPHLGSLVTLDLRDNDIGEGGADALQCRFGGGVML